MDIRYLKMAASGILEFKPDSLEAIERHVPLWISVFTEDRAGIAEALGSVIRDELVIQHVLDPGISTRARFTERWAVLDFNTELETTPVKSEYVTFLVKENVLITIADKARQSIEEMISPMKSYPLPTDQELLQVLYLILHSLSGENLDAVSHAREQVAGLAEIIDEQPEDVEPSDIMNIKRDLVAIFGVLEDEYYSIGFLPELRLIRETAKYRERITEIARGLEHLKNTVERIEDRLESIHRKYTLSLQETFNKRLSILTILQAIFVPLILIAGIYGMNFEIMPELKFERRYFWILGLMALIAGSELLYFHRRGWFK